MNKVIGILVMFVFGSAVSGQNYIGPSNIVGCYPISIPPHGGYVLASSSLNSMTETPGSRTLLDLFGTNQLHGSSSPNNSDRVLFYDPVLHNYRKYAFSSIDLSFHEIYPVNNWTGPATNPVISTGQGFWLQSGNTTTLTNIVSILGQVITSASDTVNLAHDFQMVGVPYSSALNITTSTFSNVHSASTPAGADRIFLYRNNKYVVYAMKNDGWHMITPTNSWNSSPVTNITVQIGEGFWYQGTNNT